MTDTRLEATTLWHPSIAKGRPLTLLAVYGGMVVVAVILFGGISSVGGRLAAPAAGVAVPAAGAVAESGSLFQALVALVAIVATARVMGALLGFVGQPAVIGEIAGGIMLGPSVLGWVAPGLGAQLLPASVFPFLAVHAQLGVVLYLFLVGLELNLGILRNNWYATLAISHASIVVPFLLGSALALALYPVFSTRDTPFMVFALFLGVSMSVTAFPVLSRILTDRGISRTWMGTIALSCAAIDDLSAWCLLALVVGIVRAQSTDAVLTVVLTVVFVVIAFKVVAPLLRRWLPPDDGAGPLSRSTVALVVLGMLAAAATTEVIGIHAFFGAFVFGAAIPSDSRIARECHRQLHDIVAILFLPAFFAYTGMRTEIGLIAGTASWLWCGAIIATACLGKCGGTLAASRLVGLGWRDSAALGVLMNTRGLVELIVLNVGLDLKVISPTLFTMLVIMALVTTVMTSPILARLLSGHPWIERAPLAPVGRPGVAAFAHSG